MGGKEIEGGKKNDGEVRMEVSKVSRLVSQ